MFSVSVAMKGKNNFDSYILKIRTCKLYIKKPRTRITVQILLLLLPSKRKNDILKVRALILYENVFICFHMIYINVKLNLVHSWKHYLLMKKFSMNNLFCSCIMRTTV